MKPLLMMRTKGITGPAFAKHTSIKGLSKSAGDAIGLNIPTILVPDVIGLTEVQAIAAIETAGLIAVGVGTIDPVASQDPVAGLNVLLGSTVIYTLTG